MNIINLGPIDTFSITNSGTGYKYGEEVGLSGEGTGSSGLTVINGQITDISMVSGGENYQSATITITDTPNGTGATATPVLLDGSINLINISSQGTGYTNPIVTITDSSEGGGTGATAIATSTNGLITDISMTNHGTGYTSLLGIEVTITDSIGSGASATATITDGSITSISVTNGGSGYTFENNVVLTITGTPTESNTIVDATANVKVEGPITGFTNFQKGNLFRTNEVLEVTGGTGSLATVTVNSITTVGPINTLTLDNSGSGYTHNNVAKVIGERTSSGIVTISAESAGDITDIAFIDFSGNGYLNDEIVTIQEGGSVSAIGITSGGLDYSGNINVKLIGKFSQDAIGFTPSVDASGVITEFTIITSGSKYLEGETVDISEVDVNGIGTGAIGVVSITSVGTGGKFKIGVINR